MLNAVNHPVEALGKGAAARRKTSFDMGIELTMSNDSLDGFYECLKTGLTVEAFLSRYKAIFEFVHSRGLTEDYRLARRRAKRLCDEITPVARFSAKWAGPQDLLRFNLDEKYPDCILTRPSGEVWEIEVTVAQARERHALMTELNKTGFGRGFIGVTDDQPKERFKDAMALESTAYSDVEIELNETGFKRDFAGVTDNQPEERFTENAAHSTEEVIKCIEHAIGLCSERKKLHSGDILLIEAPLEILPAPRWLEFSTQFTEKVMGIRFREVYLTGRADDVDIVIKLK